MIFGLVGLKGSGKSTAARMLSFIHRSEAKWVIYKDYKNSDKFNISLDIFAFGNNLKDFVATMFNIPRSYFDNRDYKELYYNPCTKTFKSIKELKNGQSIISLERAINDARSNRFSFTLENLRNKDKYYIKLRTLLQVIGTEICKNTLGRNIWIYPVIDKLKDRSFAVVEDIRFVEEVDAIETLNSIIIKIENTKYSKSNNHISEVDINVSRQSLIVYDGNEEVLFNKLKEIYNATI